MCGSEAVPTIRQKISAKKLIARDMSNWPFGAWKAPVCGSITCPAARMLASSASIFSSATPYMICGTGTPVSFTDIRIAGLR